ncbi:hypothetical protein ACSZMN_19890 [Aeromonas veronii]
MQRDPMTAYPGLSKEDAPDIRVRDCTRPHVIMQFGRNIMRMENQLLGNL